MSVKFTKISLLAALSLGASILASQSMAASCLAGAAKMSDAQLSAFQADPSSILADNASAGLPLSNAIRSLAASDDTALAKILELAKTGNAAQKAAIGAGLARAASVCTETQPTYAAQIQTEVAGLGDAEVLAAFRTASSDVATAALGGNAGTITPVGGNNNGSGGPVNGNGNNNGSGNGVGLGNGNSGPGNNSAGGNTPSFSNSGGNRSNVSPSS